MKINQTRHLIVAVMLLFATGAYSQDCAIFNTGIKMYHFADESNASIRYKNIKDDSTSINAMLIIKNTLSNKLEIVKLNIDALNNMQAELIEGDSVLLSINKSASQALLNAISVSNTLNGFYEGRCKELLEHTTQTLIVSIPVQKKWIELTVFDTQMSDILRGNKEFDYLYKVYLILSKMKKGV
jgi:hypothetical protein